MNLFEWPLKSALVLVAMTIDNIFWISDSPEYPEFKKYSLIEKAKYIIFKRIIPVWTSWRDIVPAIITGGLLSAFT